MKYLIAIPCMDMMHTQFVRSLLTMRVCGQCEISLAVGSLVYDARNQLCGKAMNEGFDRVLWLDSDMTFGSDLMERLAARLDEGRDMVTGLYVKRKAPIEPVIYERGSMTQMVPDSYLDYPRNDVFEVAACGFGAVMMTVELIKAICDRYGFPFSPIIGAGEDLSFCYRATDLGRKIWCDSSIKLGHVGYCEYNEGTFLRELENRKGR